MAQDLDKGGNNFDFVNMFMGPTVGWTRTQVIPAQVPPAPTILGDNATVPTIDFSTRAAAQASSIPSTVTYIRTAGFYSVGDGGGTTYFKVGGSTPGGFQSADTAWWQLSLASVIDVRQFGAKGDGVNDDSIPIQAAINFVFDFFFGGGAIILIPAGTFKFIASGVTIPGGTSMTLLGAGVDSTFLQTFVDQTILTVNSSNTVLKEFRILGKGNPENGDTGSFGATKPALLLGAVGNLVVSHILVGGGSPTLDIRCTDSYIETIIASNPYNENKPYAIWCEPGSNGNSLIRTSTDLGFPAGVSPPGYPGLITINARANSTHYNVGDIVTLSNYYIQCTVAGTTGGSPPALKNYLINIVDGGATWLLMSPVGHVGTYFQSGESHISLMDNGGFKHDLVFDGAFDSVVDRGTYGPPIGGSTVLVTGGSANIWIASLEMNVCEAANGAAIELDATVGDNIVVTKNKMLGATNCANGLLINGGTNVRAIGNWASTCVVGIHVGAGVTDFIIAENCLPSNTTAITIDAGTSNHYNIVNNLVHNSTTGVTDGGSGVNKTISGNN